VAIELVWRPQARADLLDIYVMIGFDSPMAADRVFDAIEAKTRLLVQHPEWGRVAPRSGRARAFWSNGPT
jgi:toxin ParE1/3/4